MALLLASLSLTAVRRASGDSHASGAWQPTKGIVLKGTVVTMDKDRRVLPHGSVFIQGKKIVAVAAQGDSLPAAANDATVIDTQGVIAPGLIDAHNHAEYDFERMWQVPALYHTMYDWMGSSLYTKAIKYPKNVAVDELALSSEIGKYAEVKAIVGGTTSLQGSPADAGYVGYFVRNVEFMNFGQDRITQRSVGIMDPVWQKKQAPALAAKMKAGGLDAWLVHLAEGTNAKARSEFDELQKLGLLQAPCAIIHGIALQQDDFAKMAKVGAKLIASPLDNYLLYGQTADIVAATRAGVTVSIGSDWSPFGSKNLLAELKVCFELNKTTWGGFFSDQNLIEMVTVNPAKTLGWSKLVGAIEPGMYADIAVFDAIDSTSPYRSIITASDVNVQLVVIDGEPLYGDSDKMKLLKGNDCEVILDKGTRKKSVDLTTKDPKVEKGTETFAQVRAALEGACGMDPGWTYDHSWRKKNMSAVEFGSYLKTKYKMGLEPGTLDPIYASQDPHYFEMIAASSNAHFTFDLKKYYMK